MLLALILSSLCSASDGDPILDALVIEVDRAMKALEAVEPAPYYIAVELVDGHYVSLFAEDGALHDGAPTRRRYVDVDVRIGGPDLDSSHYLRSEQDRGGRYGRRVPLTDDPLLIRRAVWRELDARLLDAQARWAKVVAEKDVLVQEDRGMDLAPTEPVTAMDPLVEAPIDVEAWKPRLRNASEVLAADAVVRDGSVNLSVTAQNTWFVSSQGTRVRHGRVNYAVTANVDTTAKDGTSLRLSQRWMGREPADLPDADSLRTGVAELHDLLAALEQAPELEPYSGPAILSDRAAGVFFHEIFGHRVEGHRLKRIDNAQTFTGMVGEPVLPTFLSVYDDPTRKSFEDIDLNGTYRFDNQGVPAQKVTLVDKGVLRGFLESRSPSGPERASNGHGRRQQGRAAVTRQGNLWVEAHQTVTNDQLRKMLLAEARKQGLDFGLLIDDIQGGFTFTQRGLPNAFNVNVLVARKIYVDGRDDELVRGVDLIGTPLAAFSRIAAAGETHQVFNGSCGAESGWVPVSATAPSLLITQIETQRKSKGQTMPPLLPAPGKAEDGS